MDEERKGEETPSASFLHKLAAFAASSIGNLFEWYEFALFGAFADIIGRHFFPPSSPVVELRFAFFAFWVAFFARPVGAYFFGKLGDRLGRIPVLIWTGALMLIPTVGITLIPPYSVLGMWSALLLLCCRLVQGISLGGEAGGGITFALESVEPWQRARMGSAFHASGSVGSLSANLVSAALRRSLSAQALQTWGWKLPFYSAAGVLVCAVCLRRGLQETGGHAHGSGQGAGAVPAAQGGPSLAGVAPAKSSPQLAVGSRASCASSRVGRICWLVSVTMLWMSLGFWAFVFVPAWLASAREPPLHSAHAIAALAQIANVIGLLGFATVSDLLGAGRYRREMLLAGAALSAIAFPAASHVLASDAGALGCGLALAGVSLVHALHGANVTVYVFERAGPADERLSTIALTWAVGSTVFAGSMPSLSEGLLQLTGSAVAPGYWLSFISCATICAVLAGERIYLPATAGADRPAASKSNSNSGKNSHVFVELMDSEATETDPAPRDTATST